MAQMYDCMVTIVNCPYSQLSPLRFLTRQITEAGCLKPALSENVGQKPGSIRNYKCTLQVGPLLSQVHADLKSLQVTSLQLVLAIAFYGVQFSQVETLHAHSAIAKTYTCNFFIKRVSKSCAKRSSAASRRGLSSVAGHTLL